MASNISETSGGEVGKQPVKTWGNKTIVFIGGCILLAALGGSKYAPITTAFLIAVIAFWILNPPKKG